MVVLAVMACAAGPVVFSEEVIVGFRTMTHPVGAPGFEHIPGDFGTILHALGIFAIGGGAAVLVFGARVIDPNRIKQLLGPIYRLFDNGWYINEIYGWFIANVQQNVARAGVHGAHVEVDFRSPLLGLDEHRTFRVPARVRARRCTSWEPAACS